MVDNKSIQTALLTYKHFFGEVDGIIGPATLKGIDLTVLEKVPASKNWPAARKMIAFEQMMMGAVGIEVGAIDGMVGPQTRMALEEWQNRLRNIPGATPGPGVKLKWPRQSGVPQFYGDVGKSQALLVPPYQLYLYDTKTKVQHISLHHKVVSSAERVLVAVSKSYSPEKINELHLNRYFGSLNVRKMRGGTSWSMHSWGIAIDFDANRNQLRWGRDQAAFAKPAYDAWWKCWEDEGWVSLGRERNYDYMHVQAALL